MAQQRPNADPALRVRRSFKIRREHFAWLALRQVRGLRAKAIAEWHLMEKGERVETGTVRTGLRDTADYIGLRLRLSPTGRPKKGTVPAP